MWCVLFDDVFFFTLLRLFFIVVGLSRIFKNIVQTSVSTMQSILFDLIFVLHFISDNSKSHPLPFGFPTSQSHSVHSHSIFKSFNIKYTYSLAFNDQSDCARQRRWRQRQQQRRRWGSEEVKGDNERRKKEQTRRTKTNVVFNTDQAKVKQHMHFILCWCLSFTTQRLMWCVNTFFVHAPFHYSN